MPRTQQNQQTSMQPAGQPQQQVRYRQPIRWADDTTRSNQQVVMGQGGPSYPKPIKWNNNLTPSNYQVATRQGSPSATSSSAISSSSASSSGLGAGAYSVLQNQSVVTGPSAPRQQAQDQQLKWRGIIATSNQQVAMGQSGSSSTSASGLGAGAHGVSLRVLWRRTTHSNTSSQRCMLTASNTTRREGKGCPTEAPVAIDVLEDGEAIVVAMP